MTALVFAVLLFAVSFWWIRMAMPNDHWGIAIILTFGIWCMTAFLLFLWTPYAAGVIRILFPV